MQLQQPRAPASCTQALRHQRRSGALRRRRASRGACASVRVQAPRRTGARPAQAPRPHALLHSCCGNLVRARWQALRAPACSAGRLLRAEPDAAARHVQGSFDASFSRLCALAASLRATASPPSPRRTTTPCIYGACCRARAAGRQARAMRASCLLACAALHLGRLSRAYALQRGQPGVRCRSHARADARRTQACARGWQGARPCGCRHAHVRPTSPCYGCAAAGQRAARAGRRTR